MDYLYTTGYTMSQHVYTASVSISDTLVSISHCISNQISQMYSISNQVYSM